MITIVPDFYDQFSCKAGSCQHTCCQGWEIDIDEPTLYRYEKIKGEIGDKIRQSIIIRDGVFIFQLTDDDRCPLLQDDGLCQIIRTLGPKKLCKVCAMHPRFFVYKSELELAGLDPEELEYMDEDERREVLEEAGLDPDDFDF